tara:strand:+ start:3061 stop:3483 length:423 start_codon:yes stop_codon:yes gene_type:complete
MRFSILFSPTKGFWSDEDGWVSHCSEATPLPLGATIQLGFFGVRDIRLISSQDISTLNVHQFKEWLKISAESIYNSIFEHVNELSSLIELSNQHTSYSTYYDGKSGLSLVKKGKSLPFEKAPLISPYTGNKKKRYQDLRC